MAAQLMARNGPCFLKLLKWKDLATSSLPVPLSPRMSTVMSLSAACFTSAYTRFIWSLPPTMPKKE